jgi:hypothetical protein
MLGLLLCIAWQGRAQATTPLPDTSPRAFAGEWAGTGEQGSYCYVNLLVDGSGVVLIDAGAGDWLGARLHWHNRQQALQVDDITPLPISAQARILPLPTFVLRSGFNQSLSLVWQGSAVGCQLQRIASLAEHHSRARKASEGLLHDTGKP